ncbi:MAG: M48 family peptidase [Actinobacteria bacterium]|nr:M48 family peptidase [Actinomycetota bacterium]
MTLGISSLKACRDFISSYRYPNDSPLKKHNNSHEILRHLRTFYLHESLKVSPSITPLVDSALEEACRTIGLPRESVEAFVFNSDQTNAQSITLSDERCIIRISSRLVELLNQHELRFVLGHELGHFIFEHSVKTDQEEGLDEEGFLLSKAAEISSDRVGLLAARSTLDATKAILKSISGLPSAHLGDDFTDFLDQFQDRNQSHDLSSFFTSHPSFLIRARALLWFDLVRSESDPVRQARKLLELNGRIRKEMDLVFDRHSRKKIHKAEKNVFLWLCLKKALSDGVFSKADQRFFAEEFGAEVADGLKSLISQQSHDEVAAFIEKELERTSEVLRKVLPRKFEETINRLKAEALNFQ